MGKRRDQWVEIFQALGEAFFAVLESEWEVLVRSWWSGTVRRVIFAALFFAGAALSVVLVAALLVVAAVMIAAIWVEPWQAVLIVAGAVLLLGLTLGAVGYFVYFRRFENPVGTAKERLADHLEWWRERLLEGERVLPEGEIHGEPKGTGGSGAAGEPSSAG